MQRSILMFLAVLAAVAITGQIVRNAAGASSVIGTTFSGLASVMGTSITGDPRFYQSTNSQGGHQ